MGKCLNCGGELIQKALGGPRKYCSDRCKSALNHRRERYTKQCLKCGGPLGNSRNRKYCSRKCHINRNILISACNIVLKKCTKCGEFKPLSKEFFYKSNTIHGVQGICKSCDIEKQIKWASSERGRRLRKKERQRNVETTRRYQKKTLQERRELEAIRRRSDVSFALKNRMRCLMYSSIRGAKGGRKWQDLVGYSIDVLRDHIKKQFKDGMTWGRFLSGEIHIDHKIPMSVFNFTTPDDIDFKRCWALSNLRPMWASENISKGNKLSRPFQPSLALGFNNW